MRPICPRFNGTIWELFPVVLSSTWRYDPAGIFSAKHWGIPYVDVIPDMPKKPRRDEILAWLKRHPNVDRFVVIDDEDDELDQLPLFQPSASTGLTEEIAKVSRNIWTAKRMKICGAARRYGFCKISSRPSRDTRVKPAARPSAEAPPPQKWIGVPKAEKSRQSQACQPHSRLVGIQRAS